MGKSVDVLVIGGGVIGLTSAIMLARAGLRCRVLDRGPLGAEASWAGAGIIPPGRPDRTTSPYDRLRAHSSNQFVPFSDWLKESTGIDNGYRVCGGVEVLDKDDPSIPLWQAEGVEFRRFTTEDDPFITLPADSAYLLPGMAQVRNPWHLRALIEACKRLDVELLPGHEVVDVRKAGERLLDVVTTDGRTWSAGSFLLAAGAWTGTMSQLFHVSVNVQPVLGQIVLFRQPRPTLRRIVLVGKRYLVPRDDGRVLAGATEEPEAGFTKRNTPEAIADLVRFTTDLVPMLADAAIEQTWSGLRPGSADGLPSIGPAPGWSNLFVATGHFRAGIQLSLATAEVMRDLITNQPPSLPIEAFRLDRLPAGPFVAAFRS